jgi:hypothetical protein
MGSIGGSLKMHHAIDTGEAGTVALIAMAIKFLLGQDIAAILDSGRCQLPVSEDEGMAECNSAAELSRPSSLISEGDGVGMVQ